MKRFKSKAVKEEFKFLSKSDMEFLIYMNTDIWITPELKRFKRDLLKRAGQKID